MVWTLQGVSFVLISLMHLGVDLTHSSSLAPKYDELAALYANDADLSSKVTVAKIDATANDVPDAITGFPTIKLFPAGSKGSPVEYAGSRTVEDLANFIKENGKHKADGLAAGSQESEAAETAEPSSESEKAEEAAATDGDGAEHDEL